MLLAFASCIFNQHFDIEPLGLPKDRTGNVDRIVKCKFSDYVERCVVAGCELVCEANARGNFDFFRKSTYDFAESPNLVFGIAAGDKNIGRVP